MFIGSYEHSIDAKGRVSLPAKFREVLSGQGDPRLVLTTNLDPNGQCLVAYPMGEWMAFQERIAGLPQFDPNVVMLRRLHIGGAAEVSPDRQGRILIPQLHREYARLESPVLFVGLGPTIEVWSRAAWDAQRAVAKETLPEINEALARFGL